MEDNRDKPNEIELKKPTSVLLFLNHHKKATRVPPPAGRQMIPHVLQVQRGITSVLSAIRPDGDDPACSPASAGNPPKQFENAEIKTILDKKTATKTSKPNLAVSAKSNRPDGCQAEFRYLIQFFFFPFVFCLNRGIIIKQNKMFFPHHVRIQERSAP